MTMFKPFSISIIALILTLCSTFVSAGKADVIDVSVKSLGDNRYRIDVTVEHADAGWDHYANIWEVLDAEGNVLGTRVLAHPHDNEQPFTRSLTVTLPGGTNTIRIRAGDSVHDFGGKEVTLDLP